MYPLIQENRWRCSATAGDNNCLRTIRASRCKASRNSRCRTEARKIFNNGSRFDEYGQYRLKKGEHLLINVNKQDFS